ncbi:CRISPR-associated protein Cas5 [Capilliphycus salinus ALCB114379]|uniref:CRISPR-associated protein Cas5 n=1 Tax=Capilliphycus salinus TaxID=2768948 RepID=UPI0039A74C1D
MKLVAIYIDVPTATFRQSHAREYGKTYLYPPHSTVYGLLLSFFYYSAWLGKNYF